MVFSFEPLLPLLRTSFTDCKLFAMETLLKKGPDRNAFYAKFFSLLLTV